MSSRLSVPVFAFALAALAFTPPAIAMQEAGAATATTPASVLVFNQKLEGSAVKLSYVYVPEKSFAVVYQSNQHATALGSIALDPGDHRDVQIPIKAAVKSGDALWISLYRAAGDGTKFDAKNDVSYWKNESLPSTNSFLVQ